MWLRCSLLLCLAFALIHCGLLPANFHSTNKQDKELAELHLRIGTGHISNGNYPQALRELLEAQRFDPKNPVVHNNLGLVYYVRQDIGKAREHLEAALAIKADYSEARNNFARVLIEQGQYEKAIAELGVVNKDLLYNEPEKSWTNLGLAYFKTGQRAKSQDALLRALSLKRSYCPAHTLLGRSLYEEKKYQQALHSFEQAVQICRKTSTTFDEPHYYAALSNLKLSQTDLAILRFEEVLKFYPDGPYAEKSRKMLNILQTGSSTVETDK